MSPQKSPNNPIFSSYSSLYSRWCTLTRLGRWSLQWIKQKVYPGWRLCQQTLLYILDIIISQVLLFYYIKFLKLALDENVQVLSPADSRIDYEVKIIITNDAQNHNLDEGCNVFKEFLFRSSIFPITFPSHSDSRWLTRFAAEWSPFVICPNAFYNSLTSVTSHCILLDGIYKYVCREQWQGTK